MNNIINDSNREYTQENYLTIKDCTITEACINLYMGREIANYKALGLDADKPYRLLRKREEIEKALPTFDMKPILDEHNFVLSDANHKNKWLGTTGQNARFEGDELLIDLCIWDKKGIDYIERADKNMHGGKKDLSVGYTYELKQETGTHKGEKYDFVMTNIKANHVALVKEGRVETAQIADSNFVGTKMKKLNVFQYLLQRIGDKKGMDNNGIIKEMKELSAKDSEEFEGGEIEQAKAIIELARKIEAAEKVEDSEKSDEEEKKSKEKEDKEAKDAESKELKKKEEEKELKKAEDSAKLVNALLAEKEKVQELSKRIIGHIAQDSIALDAEQLLDKVLKNKGVDVASKSYETKLALAELLANQANDSKPIKTIQKQVIHKNVNLYGKF